MVVLTGARIVIVEDCQQLSVINGIMGREITGRTANVGLHTHIVQIEDSWEKYTGPQFILVQGLEGD